MRGGRPGRPLLKLLLKILALGALYFVSARLGLGLAFENRNVTTVWPPTGISIAALIIWGPSVWPGIAIGALVANLANHAGLATSAGITVGNTLAPVAGAFLLRRFVRLDERLPSLRDVLSLLGVGGFIAMAVSATLGTATLVLTGAASSGQIDSVWLTWWIGDAIGVVVFAPCLLLTAQADLDDKLKGRRLEALGVASAAALTTFIVFNVQFRLAYLLLIPAVLAALRFEQLGAAWVTVLVAMIAVAETASGHGPFAALSPNMNLISLQTFNAALGFTSLALGAMTSARNRAEESLRESEERFRHLFEKAKDIVCVHDLDGRMRYVNSSAEAISGYDRDELLEMNVRDLVGPEYLRVFERSVERQLATSRPTTYEVELVARSGRRVALDVSSTVVRRDGQVVGLQFIGRDVTTRRVAEDQLRRQTMRDPVTGLANRTLLLERIEYAIALAGRLEHSLALLVIDIDGFQLMNDQYGRGNGDSILRTVAHRLLAASRDCDVVARLAGDVFAVLLNPVRGEEDALTFAYRAGAHLSNPIDVGQAPVNLTASVGISLLPQDAATPSELLDHADVALHVAKRTGPSSVEIYRVETDRASDRRFSHPEDMATFAISELELHYQPKVEMKTMRAVGVEGLVRWRSPASAIVTAREVIPMIREVGAMLPMTYRLIEQAMTQLAAWKTIAPELSVSLNVSGTELVAAGFARRVRDSLIASSIDPEMLMVEVSEIEALDPRTHGVLRSLSEIGVKISIDDFGTGYSSMSALGRLPVDEIKIDGAFVSQAVDSDEDRNIVRSMIDLAHNLGVATVAEGIENEATWNLLRDLGCDLAQGFFVSDVKPAAAIESWLLESRGVSPSRT